MSLYNFRCLRSLIHKLCVGPLNGLCSSQPKIEEQKAASRAGDRMKYAKKHPTQKRSRKDSMKLLQLNNGNLILF
jgi:hypothetical protein